MHILHSINLRVYIYIYMIIRSPFVSATKELSSVPGKAVRPSEDNSLAIDIAVIVQLPRSVA